MILYFWLKAVTLLELVICGRENTNVKLYRLAKEYHNYKIQGYYMKRQYWSTSNLGGLLFKKYDVKPFYNVENKTFLILYWRHWGHLQVRYQGDLFETCSVNNCQITSNDGDIERANAVVVNVHHGLYPTVQNRPSSQRWIFMSDESPINVFSRAYWKPNLSEFADLFNWTMSYRSDSDVPIPYGRTLPLQIPQSSKNMTKSIINFIPNWKLKRKDIYIAALISHCNAPERTTYIKDLQKYIDVDYYGGCSPNVTKRHSCPGHSSADCPVINAYYFFLAFENSICRQYITEKTFYNSYAKGNIPIIMGASKADCEKLLPPLSFLHVESFPNPKDLAAYINKIAKNVDSLLMFHQWRRLFEVVNEHGYFKTRSLHVCRVCEALNYNDKKPKVYDEDDLKIFFDPKFVCYE